MTSIESIDKNFKVETNLNLPDVRFYNARSTPFQIYGVLHQNGLFRRMPEDVAKGVSQGVYHLHSQTAGGRVRFSTDSKYVAISAKMPGVGKMPHFALTGSAGFDMYVNEGGRDKFVGTFVPPFNITTGYEGVITFPVAKHREITVNFPLYSNVSELYIGLQESATVGEGAKYADGKPIVFYGSSITQGGCASRPGTAYTSIVARKFNKDHINLGFSGSARGEKEIADYIAGLDMDLFVYDYDHNAPSPEHLLETHEPMFKKIREANPTLPIVMMTMISKPATDVRLAERKAAIRKTYDNAIAAGDKNVYFLDFNGLMDDEEDHGTVEGIHPTDWGFAVMARELERALEKII